MHTGAVLSFDDAAFTADDLDRIEKAVPDTDAGQGERPHGRPFLCHKSIGTDYQCDERGDDRSDREDFQSLWYTNIRRSFLK